MSVKKKPIRKKKTKTIRKLKHTEEQPRPVKSAGSEPVFPAVIADLQYREKMGTKKYGQSLHTKNGRNALADLYQELVDAVLYTKQRLMEEDAGVGITGRVEGEDFADLFPQIDPAEVPLLRPADHFTSVGAALPAEDRQCAREFYGRGTIYLDDPVSDRVLDKNVLAMWYDSIRGLWDQYAPIKRETILEEAHRLVDGPRAAAYGHPFDDFSRTAGMVTALLGPKLTSPLTPEDVAKIMISVKLSRECNKPSRDNRTDGAGYFGCLDKVVEERAKRGL